MRLRALPMADGTVRPVLEANVVDVAGGSTLAFTSLVDGITGKVLVRHNKTDNFDLQRRVHGRRHPDGVRTQAALRPRATT